MLAALMGTGLATSAGLNAYISLLVIGLLDRFTDVVALPSDWNWLGRAWTLAALTLLLIIEMVADKVPVLDHVNDVIQTIVRPISGGLSFGAAVSAQTDSVSTPSGFFARHGWLPIVLGLLIGLAVHGAKAGIRPIVNLSTAGLSTPAVSVTEDVFALGLALAAILAPLLVPVLVVGLALLFGGLWNRRMGEHRNALVATSRKIRSQPVDRKTYPQKAAAGVPPAA